MIRPRNNGIDPTSNPAATINPHKAIGTGFTVTARTDVRTAVPSPTSRSSNRGKDTTLISSTSRAKRNPTLMPTAIIAQPAPVEKMSLTKAPNEAGGSGPGVIPKIDSGAPSKNRKIATNKRRSTTIAPNERERMTPNASGQAASPYSRRRLISYRPSAANGPTSAKPDASGNSSGSMP